MKLLRSIQRLICSMLIYLRFLGSAIIVSLCACSSLFLPHTSSSNEMNSSYLVGKSRIDVHVEQGSLRVSNEDLMQWVHWASESVTSYYGRYPVLDLQLQIVPSDGKGIRGGKTFGTDRGGLIRIHVGVDTTMAGLQKDWTLTHEMAHLGFPSVAQKHHWIEEGIATYVEPIARVRAGHLDANEMWFELVRDLHQGLPEPGDQGLDNTHTWARTYWGGALFCFLADVEINKQTKNQKGLDDALRGILNAGGDIRQEWELRKALQIGDEAAGVSVLIPLYDKMKDQPYAVDLDAMWKDLGIERVGNTVHFIDAAPLANTRQAITFGSARSGPSEAVTNGRLDIRAFRYKRQNRRADRVFRGDRRNMVE